MDKVLISERVKSWAETQIERAAVTVAAAIVLRMPEVESTLRAVEIARTIWKQTDREAIHVAPKR